MKALVIILGLACVGLAYGLYHVNSSASKSAEAHDTQFQTFSNQLAEARTRLALEQGTSAHAQSNLQNVVDRRTGEVINTSNRLVQMNLLYRSAQADARSAQADVQLHVANLTVVEAERDELTRRLAQMGALEKKLSEAKEKLTDITGERNLLLQQLNRLEADRADLARKLEDVGFLRTQLARAEEDAALMRRMARAGHGAPVDRKARLEWQEDGTVRPVVSPADLGVK
jgi:chromosome segregation ATPase